MRVEGLQPGCPPGETGGTIGGRSWRAGAWLVALLVLAAPGGASEDASGGPESGDANADSAAGEPGATFAGSWTARYTARSGDGNDRASLRLSVEWSAGAFSGGFTAQAESTRLEGGVGHVEGIGSVDLPDRWVGWRRGGEAWDVDLRLGSTHGVQFGEGLVLGAPSFDGMLLTAARGASFELTAVAGETEAVAPEDFFVEPITLFPLDDQPTGADGRLIGLRAQVVPRPGLVLGVNALEATADKLPSATLGGLDASWSRGDFEVFAELALRDGGGTAAYVRADADVTPGLHLGIERRDYRRFASPLGNAPLYGGMSAGSDRDEDGWLLRADVLAASWLTVSWSFDYSRSREKAPGVDASVRRDHRLTLDFVLAPRTALAYGVQFEDQAGGDDGVLHSLLLTHSFARAGRLSSRLAVNATTPGTRTTLRTSYRLPLKGRRVTLLFDDTLRHQDGSLTTSFVAGASLRLHESSFLTLRATAGSGDTEAVDLTWYRRF